MSRLPDCATVDILCKVVDNFGDIGVVYRLAKALSDRAPRLRLRLHVDDLAAFHELCPQVDASKDVQALRGWTVLRWNSEWEGLTADPPGLVLECFACGRPERFEELLFDPSNATTRRVVNIEHLTAESWAVGFHLLPSATRSGLVKKWMFMPGFSDGTGGLIIDRGFREARERWRDPALSNEERGEQRRDLALRFGSGAALAPGDERRYWVSVFSYERDYGRIVADLAAANRERPLLALAAAGRSQACFLRAWESAGRPFPVLALPFLSQEVWDEALLASDFSIVRGEESWARAALAGRPFLWQAYAQKERHHLVKVRAFLDRLKAHFAPEQFVILEEAYLGFNDRDSDGDDVVGNERILPILERPSDFGRGFAALADDLAGRGDLAEHLLTFLEEIV